MNRKELVETLTDGADLTAAQAESALAALLEGIVDAVARGEKVTLAGFGTFEARHRAARAGRNPQTGEAIPIAATSLPAFKAAAAFKRAVSAG